MVRLLLILALWLWPAQPSPPTLTLTPQPDGALTITWSGAPPDATVVYGKAVVGRGAAGAVAIDPAQITPGRAAVLLDGAAQELARAVTLGLQAVRDDQGVVVRWGAASYVCLQLVGINLPDIPEGGCGAAGELRLDAGQTQYAGVGRQIGLWGGSVWEVAPIDVPGYRVALPRVALP